MSWVCSALSAEGLGLRGKIFRVHSRCISQQVYTLQDRVLSVTHLTAAAAAAAYVCPCMCRVCVRVWVPCLCLWVCMSCCTFLPTHPVDQACSPHPQSEGVPEDCGWALTLCETTPKWVWPVTLWVH